MSQDHYCRNCGLYDPKIYCKHDTAERWLRGDVEKRVECPFWVPLAKIDEKFRSEVARKNTEWRVTYK